MAICRRCGCTFDDRAKFCPDCGAAASRPQQASRPAQNQYDRPMRSERAPQYDRPVRSERSAQYDRPMRGERAPQYDREPRRDSRAQYGNTQQRRRQGDYAERLRALNETQDDTASFDRADIEQYRWAGILAYCSWLVLIPIFGAKESRYARFHVNQGLLLAITEIIWWIVEGVLSAIFNGLHLYLISTLLGLVNIVFVAVAFIGVINALNGRAKELPVIGRFRILK